ncbi:beta-glucosidase [Parelusimicrobium proximum]|uniref:glycoside hydrolase family 3 N-terminal domain-containing protein n=1 Tax=Parelusimicrobium proximum TaxID=3228953 RepID=UPI003D1825D0
MNIARLIYPGFWFGETDVKDAERWAAEGFGGFCLYGGSSKEIAELSQRLRDKSPYPKILICADYEDGLGRWVTDAELLPSNMAIGASQSEDLSMKKGLITARQARSIGVDWVFAPVADLASNRDNPIVNTRAFAADPYLVSKLAAAFVIGLSQGGALSSLKHFPGHGATDTDSHLGVPKIDKTLSELEEGDLIPYKSLIRFADSIMVGHLNIPAIDKKNIASLSEKIIKDMLLKSMNYKGCVVTDALKMGAIGDQKEAVVKAFKAGADILLVPADPDEALKALKEYVAKTPGTSAEVAHKLSNQELLITKIAKVEIRPAEQTFQKSNYSPLAAPQCVTVLGDSVGYKKGDKIHYLDIDSPEPFLNTYFAKKMEERGVSLVPYSGHKTDRLLVVCFNSYKSFKGSINLSKEQKRELDAAIKNADECAMVLLGSPFAADGYVERVQQLVFTYCLNEDFQDTAIDALMGKVIPKGILPVDLNV